MRRSGTLQTLYFRTFHVRQSPPPRPNDTARFEESSGGFSSRNKVWGNRSRLCEDERLRLQLCELAESRCRFGCRRLQVLLQSEGCDDRASSIISDASR